MKTAAWTGFGVRWRFWRIFNDTYVSAFESILFVEATFGTQLREHAIRISKERYALRQEFTGAGFQTAADLRDENRAKRPDSADPRPDPKKPTGA